jgi:hypothetical protein
MWPGRNGVYAGGLFPAPRARALAGKVGVAGRPGGGALPRLAQIRGHWPALPSPGAFCFDRVDSIFVTQFRWANYNLCPARAGGRVRAQSEAHP